MPFKKKAVKKTQAEEKLVEEIQEKKAEPLVAYEPVTEPKETPQELPPIPQTSKPIPEKKADPTYVPLQKDTDDQTTIESSVPSQMKDINLNEDPKITDSYFESINKSFQPPPENKNRMVYIIGMVGVFIIFAIIITVLGLNINLSPAKIAPSPTPSAVTPTSIPTPTIAKDQITLEVLNGSEVKGKAKATAQKLGDLGYKVIKTGNAEKTNYKNAVIEIGSTGEKFQELILSDLKTIDSKASISGVLKNSTASARIIIGKE